MDHGEEGGIVAREKKKIKQKKKSKEGEKNKDGDILTDDVENVGIDDGIVNEVDEFEKKRSSKQNKEKKKNAGVEVEVEKKGKTKCKLIVVNSKDVNDNPTNNAEKKKKREKEKNSNQDSDTLEFEVGGGVDVKLNERQQKQEEESISNMSSHNEVESANNGKKKRKKVTRTGTDDPTPNKSNKKVKFSDEVEVFTIHHDSNTERNDKEDNMVRGKRYTREEDAIIKEAVLKYIADKDLGEEGLKMVMESQKHREIRGCWKKIANALPHRPKQSFYQRALMIFWESESRKWTQEECERLLKLQEEHGNKWRKIADELGRHPVLVCQTWKKIKLQRRRGQWLQDEYQQLFDLVNTDLQQKVNKEKRSRHGMLRDNIGWSKISDKLSTRDDAVCCKKWYKQLTSPMVIQGVWADSDDYRMVGALYKLDANCIEDVNWDFLIDERSGDLCQKRWNQMILHIGNHQRKSFAEQVEVLAQRYCPHLLEAREAWDNKPRVP